MGYAASAWATPKKETRISTLLLMQSPLLIGYIAVLAKLFELGLNFHNASRYGQVMYFSSTFG